MSKEHSIKLFIINLELTIYSSFQDTETLFIIYPVLSILSSSQRNMNSAYHEPYAWHPIKFHKRIENIFCINRISDIYWNLQMKERLFIMKIMFDILECSQGPCSHFIIDIMFNIHEGSQDDESFSSLTLSWLCLISAKVPREPWNFFIIKIMFDNHSSSLDT